MSLPRFYPILDKGSLDKRGIRACTFAGELARAGVTLLQYRDKVSTEQDLLHTASLITLAFAELKVTLVLNDRPDLAVLAGWRGVHVGHLDMTACAARKVMSPDPKASFIGVSTHTDAQVEAAEASCADYVAIGPVFATGTKLDAEPAVGLEGVRRARRLTTKPIVAIGGITRANAQSVLDAGADSVAVIGGLFDASQRPGKVAEEFLRLLR